MCNKYILILALALALSLGACSHGKVDNVQFTFLDELGITVDEKLLLGDTLALPDVYCGDPGQTLDDLKGHHLDKEQYAALVVPAGRNFVDDMGNWLLLGVRDVGSGIILAAFYAGSGTGYCVELMTYDKRGNLLDAINARELHVLWRVRMDDASCDTVFTLDGYFTFNGSRATLHRTMGRCIMDFDRDLKSAPQWQQQWDQEYVIDAKGQFVLQGQRVVAEAGQVDAYASLDFKSWDMLVCSLHDPAVMDTWNEYSLLVNSTYDPDYKYNPFPWHVERLYLMNPKRFLGWMAAHRGSDNRLLPYFRVGCNKRPDLLKEIAAIDDDNARRWLTSLFNSSF